MFGYMTEIETVEATKTEEITAEGEGALGMPSAKAVGEGKERSSSTADL